MPIVILHDVHEQIAHALGDGIQRNGEGHVITRCHATRGPHRIGKIAVDQFGTGGDEGEAVLQPDLELLLHADEFIPIVGPVDLACNNRADFDRPRVRAEIRPAEKS